MPTTSTVPAQILQLLKSAPHGLTAEEVHNRLPKAPSDRAVRQHLKRLTSAKEVTRAFEWVGLPPSGRFRYTLAVRRGRWTRAAP